LECDGTYQTWEQGIAYVKLIVLESPGTVGAPEHPTLPRIVQISPAQPNPFRERTTLSYELPRPDKAEISVFDLTGRQVLNLAAGPMAAGRHQVLWDGHDANHREVSPGVYFVRLRAGGTTATQRIVLIR
jgi:hypothetical protein